MLVKFFLLFGISTLALGASRAEKKRKAIALSEAIYENLYQEETILNQISNDPHSQKPDRAAISGSADLKFKDKVWKSWFLDSYKFKKGDLSSPPETPDWIDAVMNNPCSDLLRVKLAEFGASELFVANHVGTTVCAAESTSDFDQGDEPKWKAIFEDSESYHIGKYRRDSSSGKRQYQISFPMTGARGKLVGVIVIGVSPGR